jgi:hypothetical protein
MQESTKAENCRIGADAPKLEGVWHVMLESLGRWRDERVSAPGQGDNADV